MFNLTRAIAIGSTLAIGAFTLVKAAELQTRLTGVDRDVNIAYPLQSEHHLYNGNTFVEVGYIHNEDESKVSQVFESIDPNSIAKPVAMDGRDMDPAQWNYWMRSHSDDIAETVVVYLGNDDNVWITRADVVHEMYYDARIKH